MARVRSVTLPGDIDVARGSGFTVTLTVAAGLAAPRLSVTTSEKVSVVAAATVGAVKRGLRRSVPLVSVTAGAGGLRPRIAGNGAVRIAAGSAVQRDRDARGHRLVRAGVGNRGRCWYRRHCCYCCCYCRRHRRRMRPAAGRQCRRVLGLACTCAYRLYTGAAMRKGVKRRLNAASVTLCIRELCAESRRFDTGSRGFRTFQDFPQRRARTGTIHRAAVRREI